MTAPLLEASTLAAGLTHPTFCWYHANGAGSVCEIHETRPVTFLATAGDWVQSDTDDTVKVARAESSACQTLRGVRGTNVALVDADGRRVAVQMTVAESLAFAEEIVANARISELEGRR